MWLVLSGFVNHFLRLVKFQMDRVDYEKTVCVTLVELLVVISIIALLVSILLPALNKARFQAKVVVCSSNLHQWGLMHSQYASRNEGKLPVALMPGILIPGAGNAWDVPVGFMPRDFVEKFLPPARWPDPSEYIWDDYGLQLGMLHCPTAPGKLIGGLEDFMALSLVNLGMALSMSYSWWVPRNYPGMGTNDGSRLWLKGSSANYRRVSSGAINTVSEILRKFPTTVDKRDAKYIPLMTDVVLRLASSVPPYDLSDGPPVSKVGSVVTNAFLGVWGMHSTSADRLESVNKLYADTHVEKSLTNEIETHYFGNMWHY